jgi:hypothetical protein
MILRRRYPTVESHRFIAFVAVIPDENAFHGITSASRNAENATACIGVAIGDQVLNLSACVDAGFFSAVARGPEIEQVMSYAAFDSAVIHFMSNSGHSNRSICGW